MKHVNGPEYCDSLNDAAGRDDLFYFDELACACLVYEDRMDDETTMDSLDDVYS